MQKCLGLETCDAGQSITNALLCAAKHDKLLRASVLRIPHEKLRFCMTGERGCLWPRNTDLRAMPDQHDKSRNLPNPDIFAFDNAKVSTILVLVQLVVHLQKILSRTTMPFVVLDQVESMDL